MKSSFALCITVLFLEGPLAIGQEAPAKSGAPIYSVTVVARTTKAINYQYRSGPTRIDFRGTVLLPAGKGDATVESQRGRTDIQASFENLTPPTQYGREYLTYTLGDHSRGRAAQPRRSDSWRLQQGPAACDDRPAGLWPDRHR